MSQSDTANDLELTAATWAVRVDRGLSADEQSQLAAWTGEDVRRQGALIRALALLTAVTDPSGMAANDPEPVRAPGLSRRALVAGGALAAGFAGLAAVFGRQMVVGEVYSTPRGKLRTVVLADGSRVWLNTDTRVRVHYRRDRRDITLLAGEALFDVAKDPARPFVVRSGTVNVRAVGTSFSVSRLPERPTEIMVREGLVDVGADMPGAPPVTHLIPGCRAHADEAGEVSVRHVGVPSVLKALSWRKGVLDFQSARLEDATLAFARHTDPKIVLRSPDLGATRITGQYAANDPKAFARSMSESLNLRLTEADGVLYLAR